MECPLMEVPLHVRTKVSRPGAQVPSMNAARQCNDYVYQHSCSRLYAVIVNPQSM